MFLKSKNIIFKIRRLKVTDYAALKFSGSPYYDNHMSENIHTLVG